MSGTADETNASASYKQTENNHNHNHRQVAHEETASNDVFLPAAVDDKDNDDEHDRRSNWSWLEFKKQILCVNIIGVSMIHAGLTITFSNMLKSHFNDDEISTFASLSALTTPLGCCLIGLTADRLGRKRNLLLIQISCVVTWTTVSAIHGKSTLYLSAVLCGLSRGALTATCPGYISEITHSRYRQLFLALTTTFFTLGVLVVTILNAFTTYAHSALFLSGCFGALVLSTFLFVPESPHWLAVFKFDSISAKRNLKTLNPNQSMYDQEWSLIEEKMDKAAAAAAVSTRPTGAIADFKRKLALLKKCSVYKPCLTLLALIFFQQFCCIYPFTSYTIQCLPALAATLAPVYEKQIFLASGIARFVISLLTSAALTAFNQKQLLILSAAGMCCSSLLLLFLRFQAHSQLVEWIGLVGFTLNLLSGFVALVGVPWTIIFELLPTEAKGFFGPLLVAVGYATMSLVLKLFPFVYEAYTTYVFVYTAVVSLCAIFYVKYFIVETKGKSLYEIENMYAKHSPK